MNSFDRWQHFLSKQTDLKQNHCKKRSYVKFYFRVSCSNQIKTLRLEFVEDKIMNWNTVYITGKCGFEKEVHRHLAESSVAYMPGSMDGQKNIALFWLNDQTSLRDFKKAIGGKTVFKYRLQFFTTQEEANKLDVPKTTPFTAQEEAMVRNMTHWQEEQFDYKHSA
jgi:hypothetical protein